MLLDLSRPRIQFTPETPSLGLVSKSLALIEVIAIVGVSTLAALQAQQRLISPGLGETLGLIAGEPPDYIASSFALLKQFAIQYGGALALVLLLAFLRKRTTRGAYALTTRPTGLSSLIVLGVIAGFIVSVPTQAIFLAKEIWPLGQDTVLWTVMESNPWDASFWIFAATASFLIVPIIEELMWRSYTLGRLVEAFKPGAALLLSSLVFGALHVQYLASGDFLGYATMASVIIAALLFGMLTLTTGSVLPAIIAHMILNIPMTTEFGVARLTIGVLFILMFAKPLARYISLLLKMLARWDMLVMLLLCVAFGGGAYTLLMQKVSPAIILGGVLIISLLSSFLWKSSWRNCDREAA